MVKPEHRTPDDMVTVMRAMANPRKTAYVYFAMANAMAKTRGLPLSDREQRLADELCRAFGEESLTDRERQAVERLAGTRRFENREPHW